MGLGSSFRPWSDGIKLLGHLHHSVHTRPSGSRSCERNVPDDFVPVHVADLRMYITSYILRSRSMLGMVLHSVMYFCA